MYVVTLFNNNLKPKERVWNVVFTHLDFLSIFRAFHDLDFLIISDRDHVRFTGVDRYIHPMNSIVATNKERMGEKGTDLQRIFGVNLSIMPQT